MIRFMAHSSAYTPGPGDPITWSASSGRQADPRTDESDERTSAQAIGLAAVTVTYTVDADSGAVCVLGAEVNGEFVEADEFSAARVGKWECAIEREWAEAAAQAQIDAYDEAQFDRSFA